MYYLRIFLFLFANRHQINILYTILLTTQFQKLMQRFFTFFIFKSKKKTMKTEITDIIGCDIKVII